jgi:flavin-dependent dehydrogenase
MAERPVEVAVVGGGPGGAACAISLARLCVRVALLEQTACGAARFGETLPPGAAPHLHRLGVWEAFARGGHLPSPGTVVVWGNNEPYENDFIFDPYGNGWHLDRARFDTLLADAAAAAGATVLRGHLVRSAGHAGAGRWRVAVDGQGRSFTLAARFLVDAAGRRDWPGRPGRGRQGFDRLVALVGALALDEEVADQRLVVEAAADGWWYSAPRPGGGLVAAYLTDSDLLPAAPGRGAERWAALLGAAPHTRRRVGSGRLVAEPRVAPAHSAVAREAAGADWVKVGDAAATYDPLCGQGLVAALASGAQAAGAVHRALGGDGGGLREYGTSLADGFRLYLQTRRAYYRRETRWPHSSFWSRFRPATVAAGV